MLRLVCANGITTAHPILTIMFKDVLRTFEVEVLKLFNNIEPHDQPRMVRMSWGVDAQRYY